MKRIEILQFLRACGAFSVFLSHYLADFNIAYNNLSGQLGVAIFFIISGYLLIERTDYCDLNGYFLKKIVRIIPLYWLLTCVVIIIGLKNPQLLHTSVISLKAIVKSLFLIPDQVQNTGYVLPILPIAWTLYYELYVYVMFYLCIRICKERKKAGVLTTAILLLLHILCNIVKCNNVYLNTYGGMVVLYFGVGMVTSILDNGQYERNERRIRKSSAVIFVLLFIIAEQFYGKLTYWKIILVGLVYMFIIYFIKKWSVPKFFINYGNISYSFYLLHYFVIKFFSRVINFNHENVTGIIAGAIVTFAITYILSIISYKIMEKKFGVFLYKRLLKENN